jgi:hypothetical protein
MSETPGQVLFEAMNELDTHEWQKNNFRFQHESEYSYAKARPKAEPFPKPCSNIGREPCGECHLKPGETCDICGAVNRPDRVAESGPTPETDAKRAGISTHPIAEVAYNLMGGHAEEMERLQEWKESITENHRCAE